MIMKRALLICTIFTIFSLTACAQKECAGYVQAELDSVCKNNVSDFAELTGESVDKLHDDYNLNMRNLALSIVSGLNCTEAEIETIKTAFIRLYMAADYKVHNGTSNADGSVTVSVDIVPVLNLARIYDDVRDFTATIVADYAGSQSFSDNQDPEKEIRLRIAEIVFEESKDIVYGEPKSYSVIFYKDAEGKMIADRDMLESLKMAIVPQEW